MMYRQTMTVIADTVLFILVAWQIMGGIAEAAGGGSGAGGVAAPGGATAAVAAPVGNAALPSAGVSGNAALPSAGAAANAALPSGGVFGDAGLFSGSSPAIGPASSYGQNGGAVSGTALNPNAATNGQVGATLGTTFPNPNAAANGQTGTGGATTGTMYFPSGVFYPNGVPWAQPGVNLKQMFKKNGFVSGQTGTGGSGTMYFRSGIFPYGVPAGQVGVNPGTMFNSNATMFNPGAAANTAYGAKFYPNTTANGQVRGTRKTGRAVKV
ncbi:MAG: hypothetical protein ABSG53_03085 [Thermoguttaceae bacterium]|jgi:hypothetical protein